MPEKVVIGNAELWHGDCLEILPQLGPVQAVITDPPYSSGARTAADVRGRAGMSRGALWKQDPLTNDRMTTTGFVWMMRHVAMDCAALLEEGGSLLSFIDWRQYPTLYGALETCNLRVQTMVVWDKQDMALGNGFRNQHELLIHAAKGVPRVYDKAVPNVLRCKRISASDDHPTEKPQSIYEPLIRVVTDRGHTILDPFMGSGSAGVACANTGRKFIGIEIERRYFDVACRRLEQQQNQGLLLPPEPVREQQQTGLALEP